MPRLIVTILGALLLYCSTPSAQHPADALIAAIEGPQTGREGDLVALTLADAMKKMGVPGLSVAVIKASGTRSTNRCRGRPTACAA